MSIFDQAPHLQHFALIDDYQRFWKRVGGEWVTDDEATY
jgi:hypothetical protein